VLSVNSEISVGELCVVGRYYVSSLIHGHIITIVLSYLGVSKFITSPPPFYLESETLPSAYVSCVVPPFFKVSIDLFDRFSKEHVGFHFLYFLSSFLYVV
jgi:hypothetical protein